MSNLAINDTVFFRVDGKIHVLSGKKLIIEKLIICSDNNFRDAVIRVVDKNGKINTIKHNIKQLIQFKNSKSIDHDITYIWQL